MHAFDHFGGVPWDQIRYDNLSPAVSKVLKGRDRDETSRWVAFRSHYGFDPFYCEPGKEGAHEKGGVEGEGGRFRRNHLVPVPKVNSLAELNARLQVADDADDARRIANRVHTVGHDFDTEAPMLRPLPTEVFETGLVLTPRVDTHARVVVRQNRYSVPARLIGRKLRVLLRATEVIVLDGRREVARHERAQGKGAEVLVLDHYLEVLQRKPGALPGATALVQARKSGAFAAEYEAFWGAARAAHGDGAGTRELIELLLLHRRLAREDVLAGLRAATAAGATRADVVAVEARRVADQRPGAGNDLEVTDAAEKVAGRVVSLTERRLADPQATIAALPPDRRSLPSVTGYDELLARRQPIDDQPNETKTGGAS